MIGDLEPESLVGADVTGHHWIETSGEPTAKIPLQEKRHRARPESPSQSSADE
jgi:hypothetical protein